MRRALALCLVALTATVGLTRVATPAGADVDRDTAEAQFVDMINQLRVNNSLPPLDVDAGLRVIGQRWAYELADAGTLRHNPNLVDEVNSEVTTQWVKLGENVGWDYTVRDLFDAFVSSPEHYRNLVDPSFTRVGVGVVVTPGGQIFTAHEFMAPGTASSGDVEPQGGTDDARIVSQPEPVAPTSVRPLPPVAAPTPHFVPSPTIVSATNAVAAAPASARPGSDASPAEVDLTPGPPRRFVTSLQQVGALDPPPVRPRIWR